MAMTGAERQARYMQRLLARAKTVVSDAPPTCSFCAKTADQVVVLIAGGKAMICDECVEVCLPIIAERRAAAARKSAAAPPEPIVTDDATLPEPIVTDAPAPAADKPEVVAPAGVRWTCQGKSWIGWVANRHTYTVEPRGQLFQALRRVDADAAINSWTSTWDALGKFKTLDDAKARCETDARAATSAPKAEAPVQPTGPVRSRPKSSVTTASRAVQ